MPWNEAENRVALEAWKASGGYGSQSSQHDNPNAKRERIWFSKHCLREEAQLF